MKSKNWRQLENFLVYCIDHPEERFWQALSNWSQQPYLGRADNAEGKNFKDMFYVEDSDD